MHTLGSPASVVAAIREDAEAEAERIRDATDAETAAIRTEAASASVAVADREERLAAARRDHAERIAKQEWEGRRALIEQREQWIQHVVETAQQRWPAIDTTDLDAFVREARARMPGGESEIAVRAADRGRIHVADARVVEASIAGGCIVVMGDVAFDNSFEARSRRLEPEWRTALSGMYTP